MFSRRSVAACAAMAAAGGLGLAGQASAATATTPFNCRASVAYVKLLGLPALDPLVANNPSTPCANGSAGLPNLSVPGTVSADLVQATTTEYASPTNIPAGQGATASALVNNAHVTVGGVDVVAGVLQSSASYTCNGGKALPKRTATSSVAGLTINGQVINVPQDQSPVTINVSPLVTILLNQRVQGPTPDSVHSQALVVHSLVGDVVLADSFISKNKNTNPCA